jgi:hypothetical protein
MAAQAPAAQLFSLYVGKTVLEFPQDCKRGRLIFVFAAFFSACIDVR